MGFLQDFGLVPTKQPPMNKDFKLYQRNTTTDLKKLAKNLKPLDRAKFFNILKAEGRWGKTTSNRQIIDIMRKRGETRPFRARIKDQVLTTKTKSGLTPEQIARNVRLTTFDRIKEDSQSQFGQGGQYQKESSLAGSYGKGEIGATAKRPGATRQERDYDKQDRKEPDLHLPLAT